MPHSISLPRTNQREMTDLLNVKDREFNGNPIHSKIAQVLHDIHNSGHYSKKNKTPLRSLANKSNKKAHSFHRY